MYTIQSNRLRVCISEPNVENNTSRFDRAGFITSIVLDGKLEFCGDERGGTNGIGLCSEITTDVLSDKVAVGEQFPKFGVGLLEKHEALPYKFLKFYKVDPFVFRVIAEQDKVIFHTQPQPFCGYALSSKKTVSVRENVLRVDYEVTNAGENDIDYAEYCHNFLTVDFNGVHNDYDLNMQAANAESPYKWNVKFNKSGYAIYGREYFTPHHFNIWSPGFVICPEVYFKQLMKPGETVIYARECEFSDLIEE